MMIQEFSLEYYKSDFSKETTLPHSYICVGCSFLFEAFWIKLVLNNWNAIPRCAVPLS